MKFACCKATTEGSAGILSCPHCKRNYHIACLFPTDKKKQLTSEFKKKWFCPECSTHQSRSLNTENTPVRSCAQLLQRSPDNITTRRGGTSSFKSPIAVNNNALSADSIREIISEEMEKLRRSLESSIMNRISSDLNCIKQEIISLKDSITFINSRYDDFSKTISTLEKINNSNS